MYVTWFIIILCASLVKQEFDLFTENQLSIVGEFFHFYAWLAHSTTFESTIKLGVLNISLASGKMVNTDPYGTVTWSFCIECLSKKIGVRKGDLYIFNFISTRHYSYGLLHNIIAYKQSQYIATYFSSKNFVLTRQL